MRDHEPDRSVLLCERTEGSNQEVLTEYFHGGIKGDLAKMS